MDYISEKRSENQYSIMTTITSRRLSERDRRLRTQSSPVAVFATNSKVKASERNSLPIHLQRQASEQHIYDPSWRQERSSSEDLTMQYTALKQDNEQQYDDAQSAHTIKDGISGTSIH